MELEEYKEPNEVINPHYSEVRYGTDDSLKPQNDGKGDDGFPLLHKESMLNSEQEKRHDSGTEYDDPTTKHHQVSPGAHETEIEDRGSINNGCDITEDVSSLYAVVNKNKKTPKSQSNGSSASRADSAIANESQENERLKQHDFTEFIAKTGEDKNQMHSLREKSPSPEYAELLTKEKKVPVIIKCLAEKAVQEKNGKSDSHEYDKVASIRQASAKVTKGEAKEVEQHYYYTLENPEETCNNNTSNKKEEATNISNIDDPPAAPSINAEAELVSVT